MEELNWINNNYQIIIGAIVALFFVMILVFLILIIRLGRLTKQYRALMRGADKKNLEELILEQNKLLNKTILNFSIYEDRLSSMEQKVKSSLLKSSLVRFNAFHDMGGELSYALVLLNEENDGVILSSIYGRDDARTYAKRVKAGRSEHPLSSEEEVALKKALFEESYKK